MLSFEINKQTSIIISGEWLKKIADTFYRENKLRGHWYFSLAFSST